MGEPLGVDPKLMEVWQSRLVSQAEKIFDSGKGFARDFWLRDKELHAKIGRLTVKRDV